MKKYLCILASLVTLSTGIVSCQSLLNEPMCIGKLEDRCRVPATVMSANSPSSTIVFARAKLRGGSAGETFGGTVTVISQKVTIRRHDNNMLVAGSITLDSTDDRLYRGSSGYALIGQRSGELRGFEKTSD